MTCYRILAAIAGLLLLSATGHAAAQQTLRCESSNGTYKSCPVDTRGGVTLSRQLSRQGCWQDDTWGYDRNRIWVNHGCRAEFRVGTHSGSSSGNDAGKVVGALVLGAIVAAAISNHHKDRDDDRHDHDDGWYGGREFTCESQRDRFTRCGRVERNEHVEIRRQLSSSSCIYGRSWGVERNQVWVDDGCRAVFVAY